MQDNMVLCYVFYGYEMMNYIGPYVFLIEMWISNSFLFTTYFVMLWMNCSMSKFGKINGIYFAFTEVAVLSIVQQNHEGAIIGPHCMSILIVIYT